MRMKWLAMLAVVALFWNVQQALAEWVWYDDLGWIWNARLNVEGAIVRVVWSIDDKPEDAIYYRSQMWVFLPVGAERTLVSQMTEKEKVHFDTDPSLHCLANGIQMRAEVRTEPNGRGANIGAKEGVALLLVTAPDQPRSEQTLLSAETGTLQQVIKVSGLIPANHPNCTD